MKSKSIQLNFQREIGETISLDPDNDYIGIDCLALPENFSGAAYYIYHLAKNLLLQPRSFRLMVFCKPQHRRLFENHLKSGDRIMSIGLTNRGAQLLFYEFKLKSLLIKERVKVFYATHYICPPRDPHYMIISTFHDMGFLLYPKYYPMIKRIYFGSRMESFLQRADIVVTVSRTTGESIIALFPHLAGRIVVAYPGTDHLKSRGNQFYLEADKRPPFILAVNTFEKRKNVPFLIEVFNILKGRYKVRHQLRLVGHRANGHNAVRKAIRKSPFAQDIIIENSVSVEKLNHYYKSCEFFMNASTYEGFGFTPLEAIQHGRPVFLYKNDVVAELLGDHPHLFDHLNAEEWSAEINRSFAEGFRNQITPKRIAHLTWQHTAENIAAVFESISKDGKVSLVS